jgi:hypothetical protein
MTFEEWYEKAYPDLDSMSDNMYFQLEECWHRGHSSGYCEGLNHGYEDSKKVYNEG